MLTPTPTLDAGAPDAGPGQGQPGWPGLGCVDLAALSADALRAPLEALSGAAPITVDGRTLTLTERASAESRRVARAYLAAAYRELGYTVSEHVTGSATNLIAERKRAEPMDADPMTLIVSAHLDSVSRSPGADDDASGIVAGLAVASALADCPLATDLRFIAFDEEELGLVGSTAYASAIRAEVPTLLGMLQLEMMGYDSDADGSYMIVDCARMDSAFLADAVTAAVDELGLPLTDTRYCTDASDHSPFWDMGVPAIAMGEAFFGPTADPNPCYHAPCDTIASLNLDYMSALTTAVAHAVASLSLAPASDP